jgi:type IV pilus assembly protein PilM
MLFAFGNRAFRKQDQIVSIDLGCRTTKAVVIQHKGDKYVFKNYVIADAPIYEKNLTAEILGEHLKSVLQKLETKSRRINLALNGNDSLVRIVELPMMSVADMRLMLKHSSKMYLQQELLDFVFDCYILPPGKVAPKQQGEAEKKGTIQKFRVVVGGAKQQLVDEIRRGAEMAGVTIDNLVPELICPVNALEYALPEVFKNDSVAVIDIGFKGTSISILIQGELVLNRLVNIGGDKFTSGLAESLGISYAEAEGIKIGMPEEVQNNLEPLVMALGRELRASIDFCEHQFNTTISQTFISGGSVRSEFIAKCLQSELFVPARLWNPAAFMELGLPPQLVGESEQVAPQLTVAIGAAVCSF